MNYHLDTLSNGLRVLTIPIPGAQSVTVMILVGAGSRYEDKRINGLSHFLEHMAFKGTEKRPNSLAIASEIDGIGGEFNAFTSKDHTAFYIKAAKKHLPLLVDVLSDMLLHSKFDPAEIEKEKGVIIEEIRMYEDMPMRKIGDLYENLLYGDTRLGRDIAGTEDVIRSITRKDFTDYTGRFYSPKNMVVVVAGGVGEESSKNKTKQLIEDKLGQWKGEKVSEFEKYQKKQTKPGLLVHYKDTQQAHMSIGFHSYALTDPRRYGLHVLTSILGGGMSSRLFIEVRERRGLAYYVRSGNEHYQDVGNFVTQAGVDVKRIDDAIIVILEEYRKIKDVPVKPKELTKAKEYLKGKFILDLEDSQSVAGLFASAELLEKQVRTPDEILAKIEAVTVEEIQEIARDIFREDQLNLAVIGPYKDEKRFRKLLTV